MFLRKAKGQSTLEYVILIGFVVAALIAMGVYMKRGFQGKLRESTDQIGEQYSPGHTTGTFTTTVSMSQTEAQASGGKTTTTISKYDVERSGSETVATFDQEYWGRAGSGN